MKDTIRLFTAAVLPQDLKTELQGQLLQFQDPAIRLVPAQNLHLTLYFIGNAPVQQLSGIKHKIQQVVRQHAPFTLTFERTEPGPKPAHPRLVWARFAPHPQFEALSHDLTQALAEQPPAKQKAIPHVTLARFRKDKPAPKGLPTLNSEKPLLLPVSEIALWQSELAAPHPIYTVLESYPLGR
ncbi:2'-5' RNA ligase [Pontibacter ummariensis]|uniref:RNA 2',3'-cyclic phosphodiesterase n=1 Tax=Pontibacter ummariensis TaxID=1610492 RepID=A0A239BGL6_9BACT|nr:RNA 2',3'-cyclic phosphodiesterase [Pontibacter ummariensis]PRY16534.1 2'-5' RNA ligase [Pontibacter ummariensis]SNS06879.1 2'-5' RNA ligase [Pontibacter ummariensis]